MADKAYQFHRGLLHPRCWLTWLSIGCWWLISQLPYAVLLPLGRLIGAVLFRVVSERRRIAKRNLDLCFPELTESERQAMLRRNFQNMGIAVLETGIAWWWPVKRFHKLVHFEGLENLEKIGDRGALILGIHYTTLEIGAAAISSVHDMCGMYRAHKNPVYDYVQARGRIHKSPSGGVVLERKDVRGTMKLLKSGGSLWYGPDQDYGLRQGVFAPFFGIQAATVYATARFVEKTGAAVVPFIHIRLPGLAGYRIQVFPPLENFPTGDDVADATTINQLVEKHIRLQPDQYLWVHKRFKNRPPGESDFYENLD